jgi:hypothetical protein
MGEPLANYRRVVDAVRRICDPAPDGLGISQRSVTVSTVGLVPAIRKLTEAGQVQHGLVAYGQGGGVCDTHQAQTSVKLICGRSDFRPGFCVFALYRDRFGVDQAVRAVSYGSSPPVTRKGSLCVTPVVRRSPPPAGNSPPRAEGRCSCAVSASIDGGDSVEVERGDFNDP